MYLNALEADEEEEDEVVEKS